MAYKFVFGLQSRRDKISFHCEQSIDETVRWSLRERVYQNRIIFVDFGFLIFFFFQFYLIAIIIDGVLICFDFLIHS